MVYVNRFFTPNECALAMALFPPFEVAGVNSPRMTTLRKSRVAFLQGQDNFIHARLWPLLQDINYRFYSYEVEGLEPIQLTEYGEGEFYGEHLDIGPVRPARHRKLSATIQLSASDEYEGGDLKVWGLAETPTREQGDIIIFPSYYVHQVTPVTKGIRKSLVAWAFGQNAFK